MQETGDDLSREKGGRRDILYRVGIFRGAVRFYYPQERGNR